MLMPSGHYFKKLVGLGNERLYKFILNSALTGGGSSCGVIPPDHPDGSRFLLCRPPSLSHRDFELNPLVWNGWSDGVAHMRSWFQVYEAKVRKESQVGVHVLEIPTHQLG